MNYRKLIEKYYQSYKDVDKEALRNILTKDMQHISSYKTYTDRDTMIDEIWPHVGNTWAEELQIYGSYPEFMVRYKVTGGEQPDRNMCEFIRFEENKIAEIEVYMGRELSNK